MDFVSPRKRKRKEPSVVDKSLQYFELVKEEIIDGVTKKFFNCSLCKRGLNGTKESNLASHLQFLHKDIYDEIKKCEKDPILIKRLKVIQNAVEIVSVNGRPFQWLLDSGYQEGIKNKLKKFREAGCAIQFDDHMTEIKSHLHNVAEKVREKLRNEFNGRPLSLIIDIVTKNNRSIMFASLQFIMDGDIKIRLIGMIELLEAHTGIYLAKSIIERLEKLSVELRQIYTITTDNGRNVLKMVRDVDCHLQNAIIAEQLLNHPSSSNNILVDSQSIDAEIERILNETDEVSDEEALNIIFQEENLRNNESLLSTISSDLISSGVNRIINITGINCAAHTLQLAINDALKNIAKTHMNVISLCQKISKFFRLDSTHREASNMGFSYRKPHLSCPTRWCSTYLMVK